MNLSRMTREAEQRELRLRDDMEQLTIQQDQTLGTLDSKIDAMMERQTQAKRFRGIRSRRNENTKQFEHKTKRDLWADVRHGATRKQYTVNKISCGASGDQEPK